MILIVAVREFDAEVLLETAGDLELVGVEVVVVAIVSVGATERERAGDPLDEDEGLSDGVDELKGLEEENPLYDVLKEAEPELDGLKPRLLLTDGEPEPKPPNGVLLCALVPVKDDVSDCIELEVAVTDPDT